MLFFLSDGDVSKYHAIRNTSMVVIQEFMLIRINERINELFVKIAEAKKIKDIENGR